MYTNFEIIRIINAAANEIELQKVLDLFLWLESIGEKMPRVIIHFTALKRYTEF